MKIVADARALQMIEIVAVRMLHGIEAGIDVRMWQKLKLAMMPGCGWRFMTNIDEKLLKKTENWWWWQDIERYLKLVLDVRMLKIWKWSWCQDVTRDLKLMLMSCLKEIVNWFWCQDIEDLKVTLISGCWFKTGIDVMILRFKIGVDARMLKGDWKLVLASGCCRRLKATIDIQIVMFIVLLTSR